MTNLAKELRDLMERLDSIVEFAPGDGGGPTNYYLSTENFINNYNREKEEQLKSLDDEDNVKLFKQQIGYEIEGLEDVKKAFINGGVKAGFDKSNEELDSYLQAELGKHWISQGLPLKADWLNVYKKDWGRIEDDDY